jgi:hypothetical protein
MKYMENKSNITEYKQKEIQGKKLIAYTLIAHRGGGTKEAQQWTEGSETGVEKIGINCKKTQKNT